MNIFRWVKSLFTRRGKALSLYRRGMGLAKEHDHEGAIAEYTSAIELENVPDDVKAMALFNRGVAYGAVGDYDKSIADLEEILTMDKAPENVKTMARQKLAKRESRKKGNG